MTQQTDRGRLQGLLSGSLDLIRPQGRALAHAPLEGLPDQRRAMHCQAWTEHERSIRLLHHFACTGGTVLSKGIAAMPNVVLLSEIDPLATNRSSRFSPGDLMAAASSAYITLCDRLGYPPLEALIQKTPDRHLLLPLL